MLCSVSFNMNAMQLPDGRSVQWHLGDPPNVKWSCWGDEYTVMLGLLCKILPPFQMGSGCSSIKQLKEEIAKKNYTSPDLLILRSERDWISGDVLLEFDDLPMEKLKGVRIAVFQGPSRREVAQAHKKHEQILLEEYVYPIMADSIYYGTKHTWDYKQVENEIQKHQEESQETD